MTWLVTVDTEEKSLTLEKERLRWERVTAIVLTGTRRDMDVSQQELASRLGWTRNMIANLEYGRLSLRLSYLFLIARALNVSAETLMLRIMRWGKP